ncbi:MAG: ABC transporter permease [Chloroflexi bacterium]|nr:ABC transporter permease [Chloroflexota bacterium]
MSVWRLVWRQLLNSGLLGFVASVGILSAVVLMTTGPLYIRTLERLAFERTLSDLGTNLHPQVYVGYSSFADPEYGAAGAKVNAASEAALGMAVSERGVYAATNLLDTELVSPPGFRAFGYFQYRSGLADHVDILAGRLPAAALAEGPVEVALGGDAAALLGLSVGQTFVLTASLPPPRPQFQSILVGILAPSDLEDDYWLAQGEGYFIAGEAGNRFVLPLFVPEETMTNRVGAAAPALLGTVTHLMYLNADRVLAMGPERAVAAVLTLEGELGSGVPGATLFAGLTRGVEQFQRAASLVRIPLLILLLLVESIALYSLAMVAIALGGRQGESIALVRSRGAGLAGSIGVVFLWGFGLLALTLFVAPILSRFVVFGLSYTPGWQLVLAGGSLTPTSLVGTAPWVAVGVFIAAILLLAPTIRLARTPLAVLHGRQGRPSGGVAWVRRLVMDLGVGGIAVGLLWQVQQRESLAALSAEASSSNAPVSIDRAALLIPLLTVLVALLIFYRAMPIVLNTGAIIVSRTGWLGASIALERMRRAPGPVLALGGLLLLVASLGTFAATFGGTLDRSARDATSYTVGSDVRIQRPTGFQGQSFEDVRAAYRDLPGVTAATAAYRSQAGTGSLTPGTLVPLLAIDPNTAGGVLWFRDDFAVEPLDEVLVKLSLVEGVRARPRLAPACSTTIGVWARPELPKTNRFLWLHVIDGAGNQHTYSLGALDSDGWRFMQVPLARGLHPAPPGPYTIDSILVFETARGASGSPGSVDLDDLQAGDVSGVVTMVDSFEQVDDWLPVLTTGERRDAGTAAGGGSDTVHSSSLRFSWGRETLGEGIRGIYVVPQSRWIPIVANPAFFAAAGLAVGREGALHVAGRIVPVRVVGSVSDFPTMSGAPRGFAVAHGPSLLAHVNAVNVGKPVWPNEAFVSLTSNEIERTVALELLSGTTGNRNVVIDSAMVLSSRSRSPLASASWRGLVALAVGAALVALATGFAAHAIAAAQIQTRDMALLRALGLGRRSALTSFLLEYVVIVGLATGVGVGVGLWLSVVLVPLFQGLGAAPVVPTLVVTTDWQTVGSTVGAVMLGGIITAVFLWKVFSVGRIANVLRVGRD